MNDREAFEAWLEEDGAGLYSFKRDSGGGYEEDSTQDAWAGWQACAAHIRATEVEPLREALRTLINDHYAVVLAFPPTDERCQLIREDCEKAKQALAATEPSSSEAKEGEK